MIHERNWWDEACDRPALTEDERQEFNIETRESHGGPSLRFHGADRDATTQELIELIARYETTVEHFERRLGIEPWSEARAELGRRQRAEVK